MINLSEDQHSELLLLVEELKSLVEAGYASPTNIFLARLKRLNEILWEIYPT
jgi:hypothetical protein